MYEMYDGAWTPKEEEKQKTKTMKTNKSQSDQILEYLQKGYVLTPLDALKRFGCFRLSARIFDLRKRGHNIQNITIQSRGKMYSGYVMDGIINEDYKKTILCLDYCKKQSFIQKLFKRC